MEWLWSYLVWAKVVKNDTLLSKSSNSAQLKFRNNTKWLKRMSVSASQTNWSGVLGQDVRTLSVDPAAVKEEQFVIAAALKHALSVVIHTMKIIVKLQATRNRYSTIWTPWCQSVPIVAFWSTRRTGVIIWLAGVATKSGAGSVGAFWVETTQNTLSQVRSLDVQEWCR